MVIEAVIFDNDGVLVDSITFNKENQLLAIQELGCDVSLEELLEKTVGTTINQTIEFFNGKTSQDLMDKTINRLREISLERISNLKATKNVKDLLAYLKMPYAISTSAPLEVTFDKLQAANLDTFFDKSMVIASDNENVKQHKPHPDSYLHAATVLNKDPEVCLGIEDSVPGIKSAVNANMTVFGYVGASHVINKEKLSQELLDAGAYLVFDNMADLPKLIEEFNNKERTV